MGHAIPAMAETEQRAPRRPLLEVKDVRLRFGAVMALDGPSFSVEAGGICGLIGPNGAGKTSLFNCVSRLYTPFEGEIDFDGEQLLRCAPHEIARLGISRTFQNLGLFADLTILDNVALGGYVGSRDGFFSGLLRLPSAGREESRREQRALELLQMLDLREVAGRYADRLPFGTLKRVEIARALMVSPRLLMLDEPASGLTHEEVAELAQTILEIRDRFDLTVLLVEHHIGMVRSIASHLVVLDGGQKIAEGEPEAVCRAPQVIEAYLGAA